MEKVAINLRKQVSTAKSFARIQSANGVSKHTLNKTNNFFSPVNYSQESQNIFHNKKIDKFINENKDLLNVIEQSDEAKEIFVKTQSTTRKDLKKVLAKTAESLLDPNIASKLDKDLLEENSTLSSMIVLNTGKFRDLLNESDSLVQYFSKDTPSFDKVLTDSAAQQAANLFQDGEALNDEDFFKENPKAAIFVLENSAYRKSLTENLDSASRQISFKNSINSDLMQNILDQYVADFSSTRTQSGTYNQSFYSENIEVAEFVAAGEFVKNLPSPAEFLKANPQLGLNNISSKDKFNFTQLVNEVIGEHAKNQVGSQGKIGRDFFSHNSQLSQAIVFHEELRTEFKKEKTHNDLRKLLGEDNPSPVSSEFKKDIEENFSKLRNRSHRQKTKSLNLFS